MIVRYQHDSNHLTRGPEKWCCCCMMHLYPLVKCMWPCIMYTFFTREWVWTSPSILNLKLEKGVELNTTHWPTVFCSRPSRLSKAIWSVWVCCMSRLGIWLIRLGETNLPWRHVDASYCKLRKWLLYPDVSVAKHKKYWFSLLWCGTGHRGHLTPERCEPLPSQTRNP